VVDRAKTATSPDSFDLADGLGVLVCTELPDGSIEVDQTDGLGRVVSKTKYRADATPNDLSDNPKLAEYAYSLRADGRRSAQTETFWTPSGTTQNQYTWDYDALNRLLKEEIDSSNDALDLTTSYTFDLAGNRASKSLDWGNDEVWDEVYTFVYDENDRLVREVFDKSGTADDTTTFYTFSGTQQTTKSTYGGLLANLPANNSTLSTAIAFAYDLNGRMSQVRTETFSGGVKARAERVSYGYDPYGYRTSAKTELDANGYGAFSTVSVTSYLADADNLTGYAQTLREVTKDQSGRVTKQLDYSFGLDEISQRVQEFAADGTQTNNVTNIFGHDTHGSVRVLADLAGTLAQLYLYDAYGQMLGLFNAQGQLQSGGRAPGNTVGQFANAALAQTSLLYAGESFDTRIGQQYLRARWYAPNTRTFN
jgi:hypothetical protein